MNSSPNWRPILIVSLIASLLSACSLDPNVRKQKYFDSGQRYFEKQQYQEAAIEFTNAVQIDPNYSEAHLQLAESYLHLQQRDRAYQELTRTLELRPEDFRTRMELTTFLIQSRNFAEAQKQTDLLLKNRPDDPGVHAMASSLLAAQDRIPGAIAEIQRTIALAPSHWEPYLSLALLQIKSADLADADTNLKKVIALDPQATHGRLVLGGFYQSQERFPEAEEQFRDALQLNPNSLDPRKALAGLYLAEGRKADAEHLLLQARLDIRNSPESILALSDFYFVTGDVDKAVSVYRELFQLRPNDLQVKKKYIQLLIQTRRYDEARSLDDEILKANPGDDDALVYRSQMQISDGNTNDAAQTLWTVTKDAPDNILAHYALGVALQKKGDLNGAESEWRTVLRLNPDYLDAQRSLADAAMLQGDMNSLEDAANQMIRLQPKSPDGYALRALANINRKNYSVAEPDVLRAIAANPQSAFGYVQMGNLRFAQKRFSDAAAAYQQALDRNTESLDALRGLVNVYVSQNEAEKAIATLNGQIAKSPNNSAFQSLLGSVLFHSKRDLHGAEGAFEKSIALDKRNYDAIVQLCQVRAALGQTEEAIATGEQSLKENPRQPILYIVMGNVYESRTDWKKAEDAYQNALSLNPQNPVASNDLARVMLHTGGNLEMALSLARSARRQLPDSPGVVDTLGWILYQQGLYSLAVSNLQEALTLQGKNNLPDNPDIHYHLGLAYKKSHQLALARDQFEHVLMTSPDYAYAAEIKKELGDLKS